MGFSASQRVLLAVIAALFAIGASVLSWDNARSELAPRFHWPDETTNAFFASRVAHGESFVAPEPRNIDAGNIIHPRTANVRADGAIVPGAYLGLPLWYGVVGRAFGERAMLSLIPILAALGLLAFASIIRRFAGSSVAVISTALLALHPSLWLFTATAFLPNVPFVTLVLMGFAVLLSVNSRQSTVDRSAQQQAHPTSYFLLLTSYSSSGLLLGLALTIRTHELLWVLAVVGVLAYRQRARWQSMIAVAIGIAIPFIPILFLNAHLYGSPFTTGYALLQEDGALPTEFAASVLPSWLIALVAPFGWHPIEAFGRFWKYMVVPYPWFVGFVVLGLAMGLTHSIAMKRKAQSAKLKISSNSKILKLEHWKLFWTLDFGLWTSVRMIVWSIILTAWLILYYGSWVIADPLVRETNVLTISYVRYWLPIVIVLAPWAAVGLLAIVNRMPVRWRAHVMGLLLFGITLTALSQVVTDPTEGLLRQRQALDEHRARARAVIAATEPDAVIVSHRMDKVFFPERAVAHAPEEHDADFRTRLAALLTGAPVYWYATGTPPFPGFSFSPVGSMPFGEQLYRVRAL